MNDLRICKRGSNFVIQDLSNNRKQIAKYSTKTSARAALRKLTGDIATKKVVIDDRRKVRDTFQKYAVIRLEDADTGGRLTREGVRRYGSFWKNYLYDTMPDLYLDELRNKHIEQLVKQLYLKHKATYRTAQNIVSAILTFIRWCIDQDIISHSPVLLWRWQNHKHLIPEDISLEKKKVTTLISQDQCQNLIDNLIANKNKDWLSSFKLMIIASLAFTGLRFSELIGITYDKIDITNQQILIDGRYDFREGYRKNRTKNQGSNRHIDIVNEFLPLLKWWMFINKSHPSKYLFPATRGTGPISEKLTRDTIWKTYAENNLAVLKEVTRSSGGKYFRVIESPFKGCPTKTFRHFVATSLINAMSSDPLLNQNIIKNSLGHDLYSTTEEIYGNHMMVVSKDKRQQIRQAKQKAIGLKILKNN
tara:strand:- start:1588 stop:2844 length:1257 start_codon:yes stop_codon:yes gene_type:complete